MTTPPQQPPPVDGAAREDQALLIAAALAVIYTAAEVALIASIAAAVKAALASRAVTAAQSVRLARRIAAILHSARAQARRTARDHGIPWDATQPPPAPLRPGERRPSPFRRDTPSDVLDRAEQYAQRAAQDAYRQAVADAIAATRGGLPATNTSLSALQAAQKALDDLTGQGITGFTDRTGRSWSLPSYVEMATRTAISHAYDDLQNAAMTRAGIDLIWTYTDSTEGSCKLCLPWLGRVLSITGRQWEADVTLAGGSTMAARAMATLDQAKAAGFRHPSCRCGYVGLYDGVNLSYLGQGAEPADKATAAYEASQEQRALERKVRAAGRAAAAAITPAAKREARKKLADARAASRAHRERHHVRQTKVNVRRREHPHGPPGGPAR